MQNVQGDDGQREESLTRQSQNGMRRSCDPCRRLKKRCDREQPCSRCVKSKSECKYSKRRWHQPDQHLHQLEDYPWQNYRDAVRSREDLAHSPSGWPVEPRMLPFKRCGLRASPATGLVGMRENAFISDFFGCVGFLPLASESQIREAMVKIMVPAAPRQDEDFHGEEGKLATFEGGGTLSNVSGMEDLPQDASSATFWAAVALGALAKGSPFDSVESYAQLARQSLAASVSVSTNAELARASAILAYLYSFMGDTASFREMMEFSEHRLRASIEQGLTDMHAGLPDLVQCCRKVGSHLNGPVDYSWAHEEAPLQLDEVATERDVYRFVMQSYRAFDDAVYAEARETCAEDLGQFYYCGPSHRECYPNDPLPGKVSAAIATVFKTTTFLEFYPLEKTADSPNIRGGIGDLLINGTLAFVNAAHGDLCAAFEKLNRSIEVYERYPGLCRCVMGSHVSHALVATLAAIGDSIARGMFDRLRGVFNSFRAPRSRPLPPLDEWQGMSAICNDLHCRVIETLIKRDCTDAITCLPVETAYDSAGATQKASSPHGDTRNAIPPAGVVHGEIVDLARASSDINWKQSNPTSKCTASNHTARAISLAGGALAPPASRTRASSPLDTGSHEASVFNGVSTMALRSFPRSAEVRTYHEGSAMPKDDAVAAADWLEVARAMSDGVYAACANH